MDLAIRLASEAWRRPDNIGRQEKLYPSAVKPISDTAFYYCGIRMRDAENPLRSLFSDNRLEPDVNAFAIHRIGHRPTAQHVHDRIQ